MYRRYSCYLEKYDAVIPRPWDPQQTKKNGSALVIEAMAMENHHVSSCFMGILYRVEAKSSNHQFVLSSLDLFIRCPAIVKLPSTRLSPILKWPQQKRFLTRVTTFFGSVLEFHSQIGQEIGGGARQVELRNRAVAVVELALGFAPPFGPNWAQFGPRGTAQQVDSPMTKKNMSI